MNYPFSRLLIFTRAPCAGQVKTRLMPELGAQGAADFHARLIYHCLQTVMRASLCPVELWCAPSCHDPFFQNCRERHGVELYDQAQGDLGERMHAALALSEPIFLPSRRRISMRHFRRCNRARMPSWVRPGMAAIT